MQPISIQASAIAPTLKRDTQHTTLSTAPASAGAFLIHSYTIARKRGGSILIRMVKEIKIEKRKTYSLDAVRARELARASISMEVELGHGVPRQTILDTLVGCLSDATIYKKVASAIKKI